MALQVLISARDLFTLLVDVLPGVVKIARPIRLHRALDLDAHPRTIALLVTDQDGP